MAEPLNETAVSDVWRRNSGTDLVPARMLNEFAYCPRLAYLEWVQGEFADSVDTVEGRFQHRRVTPASLDLLQRSMHHRPRLVVKARGTNRVKRAAGRGVGKLVRARGDNGTPCRLQHREPASDHLVPKRRRAGRPAGG